MPVERGEEEERGAAHILPCHTNSSHLLEDV
jgi:hypothetical protein